MESTYTDYDVLPLNFDDEEDFISAIHGKTDAENTKTDVSKEDDSKKDKNKEETFLTVLNAYVKDKKVRNNQLANMTGIDKGDISRYLNGERQVSKEHLCLICIALRLMTCQQKHLFDLLKEPMPCSIGKPDEYEIIVKHYMDGCYYSDNYTVFRLYDRLGNIGHPLPTMLPNPKKGGD